MDTLALRVPYMPQEQIDWLGGNLTKDMRVFEWGSGGSTLFMAARVKSVVSIEYGKRWYIKILWHLIKNGVLNCRLRLVLPDRTAHEDYRGSGKYVHLTFKKYAEAIDSYPDESFDLIVVDGRVRAQCVQHAKSKIKRGGHIFLDDADRPQYAEAIESLKNFSRQTLGRSVILRRLS